jgi:hypothetical protein
LRLLLQILLLLASVLVSVLLVEGGLRLARPDLGRFVDNESIAHRARIHANPRSTAVVSHHWDEKRPVLAIYNSFGSRQHREFTAFPPPDTTRIAVMGDSFVHLSTVDMHNKFSEPLDYLLNQTGRRFEVLNFGTPGYGTDQVFLQYMDEVRSLKPDIVYYAYFQNDFTDVLSDQLIALDAAGELVYLPARKPSLAIQLLKHFYLTYFVLERSPGLMERVQEAELQWAKVTSPDEERANRRRYGSLALAHARGDTSRSVRQAFDLLMALVTEMQTTAQQAGARFAVILIPDRSRADYAAHYQKLARRLAAAGVDVVDLAPLFAASGRDWDDFYFRNDDHWNEEANKLAALAVFDHISAIEHIEVPDRDAFIRRNLTAFYRSFPPLAVGPSWLTSDEVSDAERDAIRRRYLALEDDPGSLVEGRELVETMSRVRE